MNRDGLWQGQANPPLSPEGLAQAARMAERLGSGAGQPGPDAGRKLAALVASDLERAARTASVLGEALGLVPTLHSGLRERDVGAWSGLRHQEIEARWPDELAALRAGDPDVRPGGGESRRCFAARVNAALGDVCRAVPEGSVAVVTHLGVLRILRPGTRLENTGSFWIGSFAPDSREAAAESAPGSPGASPQLRPDASGDPQL